MVSIGKLKDYEVYYSELSILEVPWKNAKRIREVSSVRNDNSRNNIVVIVVEEN
jgi:hypothetical protein